jgi:hypothetical protein
MLLVRELKSLEVFQVLQVVVVGYHKQVIADSGYPSVDIIPWFIGALTNSPAKLSHYMGVQRGFLAAGEAICFGVDAINIPYVVLASVIFGLYALGIAVLTFLAVYHITETNYGQEEGDGGAAPATVPKPSSQVEEKTKTEI